MGVVCTAQARVVLQRAPGWVWSPGVRMRTHLPAHTPPHTCLLSQLRLRSSEGAFAEPQLAPSSWPLLSSEADRYVG